jgi:DNA-binding transcriptional ArsR family regulator
MVMGPAGHPRQGLAGRQRQGQYSSMRVNTNERQSPQLDRTLAALADGTRRAILAKLGEGEARVTALAEPFKISLNSVSKHIRTLERAQLVRRHIRGREHFLTLNPAPLDEAADWINRQRVFWSGRLASLDRVLQASRTADPPPRPKRKR